jgi:ABC-type transport system involved in multi-copper enzyme maturation permease subunit
MFATIFRKELLDQLISPKFLIVFLLCLVLVPASLLLNYSSYRASYVEYDSARQASKVTTTVYRVPSVLSTFGIGLENVLPKIVTFQKFSRDMKGTQAQNEVLSNITGKIDFVVIVGFLLGLFSILYASTLMSGEKESGTLKLVLSNQAKRSTFIFAKFLGGYVVLVLPLLVSFLIGMLLLMLERFPLFAGDHPARVLALSLLSLLFVSTFFSLGLLISTRTSKSSLALLAGFLVWIFATFVIPKTSEPLAGLIHPVQSEEAMKRNRTMVMVQIDREKAKALEPIAKQYLPSTSRAAWDWDGYRKARGPVAKGYEDRIMATLQEFDARYEKEKNTKITISLNISRLSPASVFTHAALDLCQTGVIDRDNFLRSLDSHHILLGRAYFDRQFLDSFDYDEAGVSHRNMGGFTTEEETVYPEYRYNFLSFGDTMGRTAPDIILLILFNLIFFAAAYYSFTRYDVR